MVRSFTRLTLTLVWGSSLYGSVVCKDITSVSYEYVGCVSLSTHALLASAYWRVWKLLVSFQKRRKILNIVHLKLLYTAGLATLRPYSRPKSRRSLRLSVQCFVESSRVTWAWQTYIWAEVHLSIDPIGTDRVICYVCSFYVKVLLNMKCNYLSLSH